MQFRVLYFESFLDAIGIHSEATAFKLALVAVVVAVAVYLPHRSVSISAKYELVFEFTSPTTMASFTRSRGHSASHPPARATP